MEWSRIIWIIQSSCSKTYINSITSNYTILHSKGESNQFEETIQRRRKIFPDFTWNMKLTSIIYKNVSGTQYYKHKWLHLKRTNRLNRHFSKEEIQWVNRSMEMFIFINYQIYEKQNYNETYQPIRIDVTKGLNIAIMDENSEKKITLAHCRWECKLVEPLRNSFWMFLKKFKMKLLLLGWYS